MTPKEKKEKISAMTAVQAINRHIKGVIIEGQVRIDLPFKMNNDEDLRIYFVKPKEGKGKKQMLFTPLSSILSIPSSPETINTLCNEYGTYLSETPDNDYLVVENSDSGLTQRIRNIMQTIIAIDGTIRIRKTLNAQRIVSRTPQEVAPSDPAARTSKPQERTPNGRFTTSTNSK